jgi:hypothetical protein
VFDPEMGGAEPKILVYEGATIAVNNGDAQLRLNFHPQRETEDLTANVPFIIEPKGNMPKRLSLPMAYLTDSVPATTDEVQFVGLVAPEKISPSEECKYFVLGESNQLIMLSETQKVLGLGGYFRVPTAVGAFDYATIHVVGNETTALENILENTWVRKVLREQRVLILRGNEVYNVMGQKMQ